MRVTPLRSPPLYRSRLEHDACGIGLLADVRGRLSHELVERGLHALGRLAHRGGGAGMGLPPDGAGLLSCIPWGCLARDLPRVFRSRAATRALGMLFVAPHESQALRRVVERHLQGAGWRRPVWRQVPTDRTCLTCGDAPEIVQVAALFDGGPAEAERTLYGARLRIERDARALGLADACLVSLSTRTVVYKALLPPDALSRFYSDLQDPRFVTPLIIVHARFSTNTFARWSLAQPFRLLAHNGEINTIAGNRLWMRARQADASALPGYQSDGLAVISETGSDSQTLDTAVDLLRQAGYSLPHALSRLMPPAWEADPELSDDERAFYQYQACASEPWEGPAALALSDGRLGCAMLDRNGFRPARFVRTVDQQLFLGSEAGIFDVPDRAVVERGRLGPGEIIVVDVGAGTIRRSQEVRRQLARRRPYREWLRTGLVTVRDEPTQNLELLEPGPPRTSSREPGTPNHEALEPRIPSLRRLLRLFGYTREELTLILRPMALEGHEGVGSMGDDTPLAAFSERDRLLPDYFRQRFAQVTNPPMDPLRERSVMSLQVVLGRRGDVLEERPPEQLLLLLSSPVLSPWQLDSIRAHAPTVELSTLFDVRRGKEGLGPALDDLQERAERAVQEGAAILLLSDRGADDTRTPMPPLLAVAAVHHALIARGCRLRCSLVVDTGEARDAHQVAVLLAFGASAVLPFLAYEAAALLAVEDGQPAAAGVTRYRRALEAGLLKIFSKMGVTTCSGYAGARLFEILGLDETLVARYFPGTDCTLTGGGLSDLTRQILDRHRAAWASSGVELPHPGFYSFRRGGDYHANEPALVRLFHRAVREGSAEAYARFTELVAGRPPTALRDLLEFKPGSSIPVAEVEPVERILPRFFGSAMSLGALGPEAHRAIAIALNRLGARSNSGEGGEEPQRYVSTDGQPWSNSRTKQVASARFGVTPAYLLSATEIQIKMSQGSKPGEGGQLPAAKAAPHVAHLRYAQPGITLISPPPHHDIYSIEDLAQLIYDLRTLHTRARINVKLVAQAGVGIVAAGVVKAGADAIQISGHDGGTGASPRGSIKHAGTPWELGLAEAQQVLMFNGLRQRVVLQADGGLKTGQDVAVAAALGAEEFGFGTALLVAAGCVMARQCHLDTCPVGIATQRESLRARFAGTPEMIETYLRLVAEELRGILARLGLRSMRALIGRADLLRPADRPLPHGRRVQVAPLLVRARPVRRHARIPSRDRREGPSSLHERVLAAVGPALGRSAVSVVEPVRNTDRAVGARLAGVIAARFGDSGVPETPVHLALSGTAGQSFGAFLLPGMRLLLTGEANDYVGKSMRGGRIVIKPPLSGRRRATAEPQVLVGNAALYGATGGEVFIAGAAGERFAVRNSGACTVVEGIGDHGCEYMTGGTVVVLGRVGRNFGAGMSGGAAYVFAPDGMLARRCHDAVAVPRSLDIDEEQRVHGLLIEHRERTGSHKAAALLRQWQEARRQFRAMVPPGAQLDRAARDPQTAVATAR